MLSLSPHFLFVNKTSIHLITQKETVMCVKNNWNTSHKEKKSNIFLTYCDLYFSTHQTYNHYWSHQEASSPQTEAATSWRFPQHFEAVLKGKKYVNESNCRLFINQCYIFRIWLFYFVLIKIYFVQRFPINVLVSYKKLLWIYHY